jgi:hypothetical protein
MAATSGNFFKLCFATLIACIYTQITAINAHTYRYVRLKPHEHGGEASVCVDLCEDDQVSEVKDVLDIDSTNHTFYPTYLAWVRMECYSEI